MTATPQDGDPIFDEEIRQAIIKAIGHMMQAVKAIETAFQGHVWVTHGYPGGMEGWKAYCVDELEAARQLQLMPAPVRKELIRGFDPNKINNRGIAAATGISETTVRRIRKEHREFQFGAIGKT